MSSCTECHRRMSANHLRFFTVEVESGRRSGRSRSVYVGKRVSTRSGGSSSTYYKNISKRMCSACYDSYRVRRNWAIGVKFGMYACIGMVALYFYNMPAKHSQPMSREASLSSSTSYVPSSPTYTPSTTYTLSNSLASSSQSTPSSTNNDYQAYAPDHPAATPIPLSVAPTLPPEDLYVVNYLANLRSAPNNGPILRQVPPGLQVAVVERRGSWARVKVASEPIGWIHMNLLTLR